MPGYRLTRRARQDLLEIIDFVADENVAAALDLQHQVFEAFANLATHPGPGHRRPDLTARPVRFLLVARRYLVVHRGRDPVQILRVLGASRDLARLLK